MEWRMLQFFAAAYNLGNFLRRLGLPRSVKHWSLTTLREKLINIGAKVVTHSGYVIFHMAEVAVRRELFARPSGSRLGRVQCQNQLDAVEPVHGAVPRALVKPHVAGGPGTRAHA